MIDPQNILMAMRANGIPEGRSGLWYIRKFLCYTLLHRWTTATLHEGHGESVMEDSFTELRRHLNFVIRSYGNILIGGLGLGCVIRGCLENPKVNSIEVIEIDADIINLVGPYMPKDSRLKIIHQDIFDYIKINQDKTWDCVWYDIWMNNDESQSELQLAHTKLLQETYKRAKLHGAWGYPREIKKVAQRFMVMA